jgi:hypothetical protein
MIRLLIVEQEHVQEHVHEKMAVLRTPARNRGERANPPNIFNIKSYFF